MSANDVLRCLTHPGVLICEDLSNKESKRRFRVPVITLSIEEVADASKDALDELGDSLVATQLREIFAEHDGLGLFSPELLNAESLDPESHEMQLALGAILLVPPAEWGHMKSEFKDWQFDGTDVAFEGLPYGIDDIEFFAQLNFSPDMWYLVKRGPMAGSICFWTHDGDSVMDTAWAKSLPEWETRITSNIEDSFGGIIRFEAHLAALETGVEPPPENAELYPLEYVERSE